MELKEKIQDAAEKVYDLVRDGKYDIEVGLLNKKKEENGIKIKTHRSTGQNIKWRSKNR